MKVLAIVGVVLLAIVADLVFVLFIGKVLAFCGRSDDTWLPDKKASANKARSKDAPSTDK